ncbi:hypothetical protein B9Z55_019057 [Caenorhabditis nigoni]|uniref:G-protein coupled receptors family 1 profile domain-containing protein n=1 Tax=Caenorhabditis nigoni TaxID=1611254 RepID=A0A2G5TGR6_9PELO|nr:hypothetical protein B9Z55_019057 [Caenorhabditis nigoni]
MNGTDHNYTDPLNVSAAVIIILLVIIGMFSNISIIYIFIRSPPERTSFNIICVFRAISNIVILSWAFLATFVPITLIGHSPFSKFYETIVIAISNTLYSGIQNTGVYIALNRFCAMYLPLYYSKLFGFKVTFLITTLMFTYRLVKITFECIHFIGLECWMTFTAVELAWSPTMDDKCNEDSNSSSEINTSAIFLLVMTSLNIATFAKIYFFYKATDLDLKERKKKQKKNQALFLQTIIQDTITLVDMIFTFRLSLLSNQRVWTFFCGTVIWGCVHSFDGVIMVMFNERLTFLKKTFFGSSPNNSIGLPVSKPAVSVAPSGFPSRVD